MQYGMVVGGIGSAICKIYFKHLLNCMEFQTFQSQDYKLLYKPRQQEEWLWGNTVGI